MKYTHFLLGVFAAWLLVASTSACTIFMVVHGGNVWFCNNEDFTKPGYIWFTPASAEKFGRVNFGFEDQFCQGSMNEKGLAFDAAALQKVPWESDPNKETPENLIEKVMDECATVEEAIGYFQKYNCRHLADGQILFADASGDGAVIGWLPEKGLSITRIGSDHLMTTNTRLEASGYRCQRFTKAEQVLARTDLSDVNELASVLDAVHQRGPGGFTSYSNIFDLKTGKIYIYNLANYNETVELDLTTELAKETTAVRPLAEFFQRSPTLDDIRAGEQRVQFDTRIELSPESLARFVGTYSPEVDPSIKVTIRQGEGVLFVENPGQPAAELFPESPTLFRISPDRGQVSFQFSESDDQNAFSLILHKGVDAKALRVGSLPQEKSNF